MLTLYELTESEATLSEGIYPPHPNCWWDLLLTLGIFIEFHGMDPELLQKALGVLVKRGKAQVFGHEDQQGVKFF